MHVTKISSCFYTLFHCILMQTVQEVGLSRETNSLTTPSHLTVYKSVTSENLPGNSDVKNVLTVDKQNRDPSSEAISQLNVTRVQYCTVRFLKNRKNNNRRTFIMLSFVCTSFSLCWLVWAACYLLEGLNPMIVTPTAWRISRLLLLINSTINPIIYCLSDRNYSRAFKSTLFKPKCLRRRRRILSTTRH